MERFDPYFKWLGIEPAARPVDHYRLLGLATFESDSKKIEAASHKVSSFLQDVSSGTEHIQHAQELLNQVVQAKLCLLDPVQRDAYDQSLRSAPTSGAFAVQISTGPKQELASIQANRSAMSQPVRLPKSKASRIISIAAIFGIIALVVAVIIVPRMLSSDRTIAESPQTNHAGSNTADENSAEDSGLITNTIAKPAKNNTRITWGAPFNFNHHDAKLFLNDFDSARNGGREAGSNVQLVRAISYGKHKNDLKPVINGIEFKEVPGEDDTWGDTGINPAIDEVLSGHIASQTTYKLVLHSLRVGSLYQVQVIGIHDSRNGLGNRQYEVSFGGDDFSSAGLPFILSRSAYGNCHPPKPAKRGKFASYGTIVGHFVATQKSQEVHLRPNQQDGDEKDDKGPGIAGFILLRSSR